MAAPERERMLVSRIEEGTVIDHIPDWRADTVSRVLRLDKLARMQADVSVVILQNVTSEHLGRKDIIKIDSWHVDERDADILCLVFPEITVNYIDEGKVSKYSPKVPDTIEGRVRCPELNCISNTEREPVVSRFVTLKEERLLQCQYCDTLLGFEKVPDHVRT
ncbi:MAG: aspartate carbamoyltransferase regulatory subunit [Nitrososphaerota archaeon]|nr:aspartate carbamoyltransferase regulatory subunit [Nitrososphaerota archaeon]MDG6974913.1 aspartate carbamoyltransferase regulatory subunit [Nitrososphaerota archaeon]MDG7015816.1 aspartate carbamoyltransferase regulatory subunit [Nitrososphaerota archaeon]